MEKKRLLTGLQPSGPLHIGNYFGALKPFMELYEDFESFLMVVDYHALTSLKDPIKLKANILDIVKAYLAVGVNPEKVVLFKQSDMSEHTELAWIFNCLVTVPFLMQGHAYKDKVAKGLEANAGLFTYPMLMASDILIYNTDVVPVGEDQRQHIEYTREAANKFNNTFGETFTAPKEIILEGIGIVPGTDGQKMSKSYENTIPLFASKDEITKAVMSIVTDSGGDFPEHVYAIHRLYKSEKELKPFYEGNKGSYKTLKDALIEDIEAHVAPLRDRYEHITDDEVKKVLENGKNKAKAIASEKMEEVRKKIGVTI